MGDTVPPSLVAALGLANALAEDAERASQLLERIVARAHVQGEPLFTPTEQSRLQRGLGLTPEQLDALCLGLRDLLLSVAARGTPVKARRERPPRAPIPAPTWPRGAQGVAEELLLAGGSEALVRVFVDVWRAQSPALLRELRGRTLGAPDVLKSVRWSLHVPMAGHGRSPDSQSELRAVLELGVGPPSQATPDTAVSERVPIEFSLDELGRFFDSVEAIQSQIDNLA